MALAPPKRALALALPGATSMVELEPLWKTFSKNDSSGNFVIICVKFVRGLHKAIFFPALAPKYKNAPAPLHDSLQGDTRSQTWIPAKLMSNKSKDYHNISG